MKFLRWQGLVAFLILGVAGWAFFALLLDGLIERGVEEQGSAALQTQIEVGKVNTSLPNQAAEIHELAVADPDDPMKNTVEIGAIKFNVDAGRAVFKKVIIDEMVVDGIKLNQKRETPAKSFKRDDAEGEGPDAETGEPGKKKSGPFDFLKDLSVASPEEILKKEKLESLEAVDATKKQIEDLRAKWEKKLETDLNPEVLEETKKKIEALQGKTGSGIAGAADALQEVQSIKQEIQGNIDKIANLKKELQQDVEWAKKRVAEVKALPKKDFERLKNKYSLDVKGGSNILGTIFGDEIKQKIDLFWHYYGKLSPFLNRGAQEEGGETEEEEKEEIQYERGEGVFVKFPEKNPFPDFLVRHAKLSMDLFGTQVAGDMKDLSDNQRAYGKPAVIDFNSGRNEKFDKFDLQLKLDRTKPVSSDLVFLDIAALKLADAAAGDDITVSQGSANIKSSFSIAGEKDLTGVLKADLSGLAFQMAEAKDDEVSQIIRSVLDSAKQFFVQIGIKGTQQDYSLDIKSDLDGIIAGAVKGALAGKIADLEKGLKKSIASATDGPLAKVNQSVGKFLKIEDVLGDKSTAWQDLLQEATKGAVPIPGKDKLPIPDGLKGLKLPF